MGPEPEDAAPERTLEFTPPPSDEVEYWVSYGWNDESKALVDRLCEEANRRGKKVLRDLTGLGLGERFSRFMQRLGAGNRVFVILSDKYLKSPNCMYELLEIWRNSKMADEEFRSSHPGLPPSGCQDVDPAGSARLRQILERAVHGAGRTRARRQARTCWAKPTSRTTS